MTGPAGVGTTVGVAILGSGVAVGAAGCIPTGSCVSVTSQAPGGAVGVGGGNVIVGAAAGVAAEGMTVVVVTVGGATGEEITGAGICATTAGCRERVPATMRCNDPAETSAPTVGMSA